MIHLPHVPLPGLSKVKCLQPREVLSPLQKRAQSIFHSLWYELCMGAVCSFNIGLIVMDVDASSLDEDLPSWVGVASIFLLFLYCAELLSRFYAYGPHMYADHMTWMDTALVSLDILGIFAGDAFKRAAILRILRLGKLGRSIKLLQAIPELFLMIKGLVGAMKAILCGTVLATFILLLWSILAVTVIHPINKAIADETHLYSGCERCPRAFETVAQSFLTFAQQIVAGDSWGTLCLPIIERSPMTALFFYGVFATVVMASMNLMLAVIVDAAQEARIMTTHALALQKEQEKYEATQNLENLCKTLDSNSDGLLTLDELQNGHRDVEEFQDVLNVLEVSADDMPVIFSVMDRDCSGEVSFEEFIAEMYKMQSNDTQSMIVYIRFYVTQIRKELLDRLGEMQRILEKDIHDEEQTLEHMADEEAMMLNAIQNSEQKLVTALAAGDHEGLACDNAKIDTTFPSAVEAQTQILSTRLESMEAASTAAMAALQRSVEELVTSLRASGGGVMSTPKQGQLLPSVGRNESDSRGAALLGLPGQQHTFDEVPRATNLWQCCGPNGAAQRGQYYPPSVAAQVESQRV